jgi:hypothetical protein
LPIILLQKRKGASFMIDQAQWDLFISHASEDKEDFVKPLAIILSNIGVKVWYDEFTLKLGDSLSRSIDKGLANSRMGVIVISKYFMNKKWPEHELKGLVQLELAIPERRIIPIWHKVTKQEVLAFSPTLTDKIAADTSKDSLSTIAYKIIEVVRPDIFGKLQRQLLFMKSQSQAEVKMIPINKIDDGPIRHPTLPKSLLMRIHLIHLFIQDYFSMSLEERIDSFRRDAYPEREIEIWESMIVAFLYLTSNKRLSFVHRNEIYQALLSWSVGFDKRKYFQKYKYVTYEQIKNALNHVTPRIK